MKNNKISFLCSNMKNITSISVSDTTLYCLVLLCHVLFFWLRTFSWIKHIPRMFGLNSTHHLTLSTNNLGETVADWAKLNLPADHII